MIKISVNNEPRTVEPARNLQDLLRDWGFECEKVAVAINEDFVPRSTYGSVSLQCGDRVDVVAPVQGG